MYVFFLHCISYLSKSWSFTKSNFSSSSVKNPFSSALSLEIIPCFIPNLGKFIEVVDNVPLPTDTALFESTTFSNTLFPIPVYATSVS